MTGHITCKYFELVQSKKIRSNEADFLTLCQIKKITQLNASFQFTWCNKISFIWSNFFTLNQLKKVTCNLSSHFFTLVQTNFFTSLVQTTFFTLIQSNIHSELKTHSHNVNPTIDSFYSKHVVLKHGLCFPLLEILVIYQDAQTFPLLH